MSKSKSILSSDFLASLEPGLLTQLSDQEQETVMGGRQSISMYPMVTFSFSDSIHLITSARNNQRLNFSNNVRGGHFNSNSDTSYELHRTTSYTVTLPAYLLSSGSGFSILSLFR
jgi:hypothetical protein